MTSTSDPQRGWRIGAPGGVPVYLSPSWPFLVLVIVLWFGPQVGRSVPGLDTVSAYGVSAVYALLLLVSVLSHEAAHAAAARATGARVGRIVIDLFGGHTVYETSRSTPVRMALVAVVGPIANGVLAAVGWAALAVLPDGVPRLLGLAFVLTNGIVGAFNLVPGHPLDGGHLLDALVWGLSGRRHTGMVVSGWAGRIVVLGLVVWLVVLPLLDGHPPSFLMLAWTGLVGAMLWSGATQAIHAGRDLGAYEQVDLTDVLAPVVVTDGANPMREVAHRVGAVVRESGREPVVLVTGTGAGPATMSVLTLPEGEVVDPDGVASEFGARLPDGWLVDAPAWPSLASVVDHMHAHDVPVVVLRRPDGELRAVTAQAARAALVRAGAAS